VILGIDPGQRRVGIAAADPATCFARPLETVDTSVTDPVTRIAALVIELDACAVVVGLPLSLSGHRGPAVAERGPFTTRLRSALPVPVYEHDERLSTVVAEQGLRSSGARPAGRRAQLDAVAAQVLLQSFLDSPEGRRVAKLCDERDAGK
jgi:putative pre-16S rRNA nuclease